MQVLALARLELLRRLALRGDDERPADVNRMPFCTDNSFLGCAYEFHSASRRPLDPLHAVLKPAAASLENVT